jgi:pimeloyl-ACP methyl ester carboxylesterase
MTPPTAGQVAADLLPVPGARLYYEVRGQGPVVVLVGAPMDARPFAPLAELLAGACTVVTTDPRGINRSPVDDRSQESTPDMRADDLSRILARLDRGPAAVLGSSGGAVTALALAQNHPGQVTTVVAHEPPVGALLDEREEVFARFDGLIATYLSGDVTGAWRGFVEITGFPMPPGALESMIAARTAQDAADDHFQYASMMRPTIRFRPDLAALRSGTARVVVGIGEQSRGQFCDRTSAALAAGLRTAPAWFPGGHTGFATNPDEFAARLRPVLAGADA